MAELELINREEVPPGGAFKYHQAETNFTITAPSWIDLLRQVKQHRIANNLPIGLQFDREVEQQLASSLPAHVVREYVPPVRLPLPREEWPAWAKAIAMMKNETDIGVGDTAERVIGNFGGEAFKTWHQKLFGRPCHCSERKDAWNLAYAY